MTNDDKIAEVLARFPKAFGLRGFPGDVFRCSTRASYINDAGGVTVYTERRVDGDVWQDFAKGTECELRAQLVRILP